MSFVDALTRTNEPNVGQSVGVARWPSLAAAGTAAAAVLLAILPLGTWGFVAGYTLGAVVTPALAVAHRYSLASREKNLWFVRNKGPGRLMISTLTVGLLIGMVNAWWLATELAKQ